MPTHQKMKVDIAKLALNLDGCRFGSPPQQQRQEKEERQRVFATTTNNDGNDHDHNGNVNHQLSPLSTHHLNHKAQYNNHQQPHHYSHHNELTSPLGTTYRREGLSIGHNFLRFQGSTLSDNFNSNQLDVLECIGRGVCSSVWKARRKHQQQIGSTQQHQQKHEYRQHHDNEEEEEEEYYALKVFSMRDPQKRTMLIRELKLLCSTNNFANNNDESESTPQPQPQQGQECECLVELEGAFLDELDGTVTLVLEYMNLGSLADLLSLQSPPTSQQRHCQMMPESAIASIAYQMIWGLGYLHHEGILHRDIKPANVLLSTEGRVKLADFGIVSSNNKFKYNPQEEDDDDTTTNMNVTMVGTTRYMSPERLHGQPYNKQADIWSLGLILLECTRGGGNSPFEHIRSIVELVQTLDDIICLGDGTMGEYIPDGTSEGLSEILMGCLNHCSEKRMPCDVLIGSPWFVEVNGIECVDDAVVGMKRYLETL